MDRILHNSLSDFSVYFREITEVFSGSAVMLLFFLSFFLSFLYNTLTLAFVGCLKFYMIIFSVVHFTFIPHLFTMTDFEGHRTHRDGAFYFPASNESNCAVAFLVWGYLFALVEKSGTLWWYWQKYFTMQPSHVIRLLLHKTHFMRVNQYLKNTC